MTDPAKKLPTITEAIANIALFSQDMDGEMDPDECGEWARASSVDEAIAPYDALIASQAEEIERLTAENAELRNKDLSFFSMLAAISEEHEGNYIVRIAKSLVEERLAELRKKLGAMHHE